MERNWGGVAAQIKIPYVTLDDLTCLDSKIMQQWDQQNNHRAQLKTTELKTAAEAAEHRRITAEQTARHNREVSEAEAASRVAGIENERTIKRAEADAETARIVAEQRIKAETSRLRVLQDYESGARHELALAEAQARHSNNKETNTIIVGSGVNAMGAGLISTLFSGSRDASAAGAAAAPAE